MNVYIRLHEGGIFLSLSCLCGLCIDRDTRQAVLFCRLSIQNKKWRWVGCAFLKILLNLFTVRRLEDKYFEILRKGVDAFLRFITVKVY